MHSPLLTLRAAGVMLMMAGLSAGAAHAADRHLSVALDGSGDFTSIQEAFAAVPVDSADRTIIRIKNGVYEGHKILEKGKNKVTLLGESADATILSFGANVREQPEGSDPRFKGIGVMILADDFRADKLTFRNTSGDHGQALALRIDGDRAIITNSRLLGWQDTLMANKGRHYFKNCYIEGRVDFIYGGGAAVFDHCEIKSKNGGYVTAASTPQEQRFGFVFLNSRLTGDPAPWIDPTGQTVAKPATGPVQAFLGRPWRQYGAVAFINTEMGEHIKPEGWNNWGKTENEATARYVEYNSSGAGGKPGQRVGWSRQLSKEEAGAYTVATILGGTDNWNPEREAALPVPPAPKKK